MEQSNRKKGEIRVNRKKRKKTKERKNQEEEEEEEGAEGKQKSLITIKWQQYALGAIWCQGSRDKSLPLNDHKEKMPSSENRRDHQLSSLLMLLLSSSRTKARIVNVQRETKCRQRRIRHQYCSQKYQEQEHKDHREEVHHQPHQEQQRWRRRRRRRWYQ